MKGENKIRKYRGFNVLRDRLSKPQIKEIKKNLYGIKTQKSFNTKNKRS